MQVTVEDKSTVKKILHIEIEEEKVASELDSAYKELKKTAKIKGFRPGKAPRSVLERMFRKDVHADVRSKLIQETFFSALKDNNFDIVGNPEIDPPDLDAKGPFAYDAVVEIKPDISDIDFKGLQLKKNMYACSEGEVDGQLAMLQKNLATLKPIEEERPAQEGDAVLIDYEGFKDDQPYEETQKTENFTLYIGKAAISKDFDDNVIGMNTGDTKSFEVTFPENHSNKNLAGLTLRFQVALKEIRKEILPDIDDDFAKKLGKFESLDALRKQIAENLQQGYDRRAEQEMNEQIFGALIEKTDFEVPDVMVQYELEGILEETERAFAQSNITMEQIGQTREMLSEKYRETAEKQVRRHLILEKIVAQEKLDLSDEELDAGFEEMAASFNQPAAGIKEYYKQNQDKLEFFKHTLLEKKAIKLIIENSDIEEVEPKKQDDGKDAE